MVGVVILYKDSPCSCRPGRYVRWIDPPGVPGLHPAVHCRDNEAAAKGTDSHSIPPGALIFLKVPGLKRGGT